MRVALDAGEVCVLTVLYLHVGKWDCTANRKSETYISGT